MWHFCLPQGKGTSRLNSLIPRKLQSLAPFLDGLRRRYAAGAFLLVITDSFALLIPWLLKLAVEGIKNPAAARFSTLSIATGISLLALLHCIVRVFSRTIILNAARTIEFRVREALFAKLVALDLSFYSRERTGDILSRFSNDLGNVRMLLGFGVMSLFNTAIIYSSAVCLMLMISPWLTLAAVAPLPIMVLIVRIISGSIFKVSQEAQEELARLSSRTEEAVSAVRLLKSYCREAQFEGLFKEVSAACLVKNLQLARMRGMVMPVMASVTGAGTLAVLYIGGRQVIGGVISLGDFVAFSGYLALLVWPTVVLGWILTLLQRGAASMGRLNELLTAQSELRDPLEPIHATAITSGLEARNLCFSYGDRTVLKDISFSIAAGERIGITGPVGSGKSTLLRMIARLIPAGEGMLLIDGVDINQLSVDSVRRLTGYVPQEAFLFSRGIDENIAYGGDADPAAAAGMAGLSGDLAGFASGIKTIIGERGITLSGGQRQRVALARALARKPDLLLLDDPLASVDAGREDEILDELSRSWHGKTVLIVSQRMSAFRDCHRVIVIEEGGISEVIAGKASA